MLVDDKSAILTQREFDDLGTYDLSLPTGTFVGKRWKRRVDPRTDAGGWLLCEYAECDPPDPDRVAILYRTILEVVPDVKEDKRCSPPGKPSRSASSPAVRKRG